MTRTHNIFFREEGSTLVVILLIVSLLTLAGIASVNTSVTEVQTASNLMRYKITFYAAEGGLELVSELAEQNVMCPNGFGEDDETPGERTIGKVRVTDLNFQDNGSISGSSPEDGNRHLYYPVDYGSGAHTNVLIGEDTSFGEASALQMAAGYEGIGKGAAGGGANKLYNIHVERQDVHNERSELLIQWRHVVTPYVNCIYD